MKELVRVAVVLAGVGFLAAAAPQSQAEQTIPAAPAPTSAASSAVTPAGPTSPSAAPAAPAPADAKEQALFENTCSACHDLSLATQQHMDRSGWQGTVSQMVGMGAPLNDQQAAEVTDYLARHYGAG